MISMKKKTKIVIGVILVILLATVLAVVGFMTWLGITWTDNHKFGEYVSTEGPCQIQEYAIGQSTSSAKTLAYLFLSETINLCLNLLMKFSPQ